MHMPQMMIVICTRMSNRDHNPFSKNQNLLELMVLGHHKAGREPQVLCLLQYSGKTLKKLLIGYSNRKQKIIKCKQRYMKIIADINGQGLVMMFATDQINYEFNERDN